jgi:hypothetical protein
MPHAIALTDPLLREACARMALRFGWGESFETVMQDPMRSRMVRVAVLHPSAADAPGDSLAPAARRVELPMPGQPPLFDRKRAAAGERDDD